MAAERNTTLVEVPGQPVLAKIEDGQIMARGIRYAEAKRFEKPQPVATATEVQDCTIKAPLANQAPSGLAIVIGDLAAGRARGEDCLRLSIWTPTTDLSKDHKFPVMVWYHGGAFITGGGDYDAYDARQLASRGVVVVNVSYRLGMMGFLPIEGVAPANLGVFDQIEALKWVHNKIQYFGGDPERVTLFGQSAGAMSVYNLMVADDDVSKLFHRAILQSGPFSSAKDFIKDQPSISATAYGALGLRAKTVPLTEILDTQIHIMKTQRTTGLLKFGPLFGQDPLPPFGLPADSRLQDAAKRIPIWITWTKHDAYPFLQMVPWINAIAGVPILGSWIVNIISWYMTRQAFINPAQELALRYRSLGGKVTTMSFDWYPRGNPLGASHCVELPLLFGNWQAWKDAPMLQGNNVQPIMELLGGQVKDMWAAIAKGVDTDGHFVIREDFRPLG